MTFLPVRLASTKHEAIPSPYRTLNFVSFEGRPRLLRYNTFLDSHSATLVSSAPGDHLRFVFWFFFFFFFFVWKRLLRQTLTLKDPPLKLPADLQAALEVEANYFW